MPRSSLPTRLACAPKSGGNPPSGLLLGLIEPSHGGENRIFPVKAGLNHGTGKMAQPRICIIGSGMAGFGAAHQFHESGLSTTLFEKRPYHGGHTASHFFPEGFLFDEGPHISFTKEQRLQELFAESVGGEYEVLRTNVNNYWRGHWIKHPAQTNLHGLPTDLLISIIKDYVAAHQNPPPEIRNYS